MPQGGGAIHGLGETFSPDLFTGTGNFSVPLTLPAGRNGLQPDLALTYSTGHGNGFFGVGWSLKLPSIQRKTNNGIPLYDDLRDTFVYGGAEDLVPMPGGVAPRKRYRPRSESLFARIEHIRTAFTDHWEVRTKDGRVSIFGTPNTAGADPAVIANPNNTRKILFWALTQTRDPFGNHVLYEYERDVSNVDGPHHWDQLYPLLIRYAEHGATAAPEFLISVTFNYMPRSDPFSHYRAGFEVRTVRRCSRIEIHTHAEVDRHVGSIHFRYQDEITPPQPPPPNGLSLLAEVQIEGHDGTQSEEMPPLAFAYSTFDLEKRRFLPVTGNDLPALSLSQTNIELVDLFGKGLPDLLSMTPEDVRYWRNLGGGHFDLSKPMPEAPAGFSFADLGVQLLDANGDGRQDLLVTTDTMSGYFPLQFSGCWDKTSFQRYKVAPSFVLKDPEVKLVDLTGDGVVDAIRSSVRFECFFNDPLVGWSSTRHVERRALEDFPNVNFSDARVRWGDMTGDGLQDLVLIHNRCVEYWPNLGYGDWGRRVRMKNNPELPFDYDPKRLLLGDVDGDGVADLIYVEDRRVTFWINQAGNGWSEPMVVTGTPPMTSIDSVRLVDLLGQGVSGILWSGLYDDLARTSLFFLDFTAGHKPYLLIKMDNRLGAVNRITYAPSTAYYLADQQRHGTRWKTPLPFPVQVVAKVECQDVISGNTLKSSFAYHHGYWDGIDREFRGFGRVDKFDAETGDPSPPLETRRWFHQGPIAERLDDWQEPDYSREYCDGDPPELTRPATLTNYLKALPRAVKREAFRAIRGQTLRTEVYARDGSNLEDRPYTVSESLFGVREEPSDEHSFFAYKIAERTTQWERGDDPMTRFAFMAEPDEYGQQQMHMDIAVPRRRNFRVADAAAEPYLATVAQLDWAIRDDATVYMLNRATRSRNYEIMNDGTTPVFALRDAVFAGTAPVRLIQQVVNFYDGPAFQGLPFGQLGLYGAVSRTEELMLTPALIEQGYRSGSSPTNPPESPPYFALGPIVWSTEYPATFQSGLSPLAGYVFHAADSVYSAGYYAMTARRRYDFQSGAGTRGLVLAERDALGNDTIVRYDAYNLYPIEVENAVGLVTKAQYDYRVLQVEEITDFNGNRMRYLFSPLGRLRAQVVMGKIGEAVGDTVSEPTFRWIYDDHAFWKTSKPISARMIQRIHHVHDTDVPLPDRDLAMESVSYSDGFGRIVQARSPGEDLLFGDPVHGDAGLPLDQGLPTQPAVGVAAEWVLVSEWKRYDNKGRVVESFERFFDQGWEYAEPTTSQRGLSTQTFYDPRGQAIRTVRADGAQTRVIFGIPVALDNPDDATPTPWEAYFYDVNDNAGRTHTTASASYKHHWDTPRSQEIDALGRVVRTVLRPTSTPADWLTTTTTYDIQGRITSATDPLGQIVARQVADFRGRTLRSEHLDAGVKRTVYDAAGRQIEHRDAKGALILHGYDALHRKTRVWARNQSGAVMTLRQRLIYGDSADSGLSATQASTANLRQVLYRHYDESGVAKVEQCDFKGNPLEKERRVLSDTALLSVFTGAAAAGWKVSQFAVDWETPGAEGQLETTAYRTSTKFDGLNRVKQGLYPADHAGIRHEITPTYHLGGGLRSLAVDGKELLSWLAHNASGQRILTAHGNGVLTRYGHDPVTRGLRRVRAEKYTQVSAGTFQTYGPPLQDTAYTKDLAGNMLTQHERTSGCGVPGTPNGVDALDRSFSYDGIYRLISATGRISAALTVTGPWDGGPHIDDPNATKQYTETYRYDASNNVSEIHHQVGAVTTKRLFTLAAGGNRLASVQHGQQPFDYDYDAVGNIIAETTSRHFAWDHSDRLAAFYHQTPGAEPSLYSIYLYEASGTRVKKLTRHQGGATTATVYIDGVFEIRRWGQTAERNCRLNINEASIRLASWRFGPAEPDDPRPPLVYQLPDGLGSAALTLDDTGGWIRREEFTPFGQTSFGGFSRKRYRFASKERDEESGLDYVGLRYYAPWLGRWTSTDPAGMGASYNLYTYVNNNPANYTDPLGMQEVSEEEQKARAEGGVPVSNPEAEREADAGAGPPPADMGTGIHFENEASAQQTQAAQIPGGAAPPEQAQRGVKPVETNKHQNEWAKNQAVEGGKAGAKNFAIDMVQMGLIPAYVIRPKWTAERMKELDSMRVEPDTELASNVASGTYWALTLATAAVGEGVAALREAQAARRVFNGTLEIRAGSAGGNAAAGATTAAVEAEEHVTLFRFYTADNPSTLKPKLLTQPASVQSEMMARINSSPGAKQWYAKLHMRGDEQMLAKSPFVSLGDNPQSLAMTSDPWLKKIATGCSWDEHLPGVQRAPDLGIFRVPKSRLIYPETALSAKETEVLFMGDDLESFLQYTWRNPF